MTKENNITAKQMKQHNHILKIGTLLVLIIMFSCSKNDNDAITTTTEPIQKLRIKEEHQVNLNNNGLSTDFQFFYSTDDLLTKYNKGSNYSALFLYNENNQLIKDGVNNYTYNSNGTISFITTVDGETKNIIYTNGLLTTLSAKVYDDYNFSRDYTYNISNKLVEINQKEFNDRGDINNYKKTEITYDSRGNVIKIIVSRSWDGNDYTIANTYSFVYDDFKNPYYNLIKDNTKEYSLMTVNSSGIASHSIGDYFFSFNYYSPNNIIDSEYSNLYNFNPYTEKKAYEYLYNDVGYPISYTLIGERDQNNNITSYTGNSTFMYEEY